MASANNVQMILDADTESNKRHLLGDINTHGGVFLLSAIVVYGRIVRLSRPRACCLFGHYKLVFKFTVGDFGDMKSSNDGQIIWPTMVYEAGMSGKFILEIYS